MESCQSATEPDAKRPKIESEGSTLSNPKAKDPFLSLPSDILVKIISNIPLAQWLSLELVDTNFQAAIMTAWRRLRSVTVERDFVIREKNPNDPSSRINVKLALQRLVEYSPFLTSLSGVGVQSDDPELNMDTVKLIAQFEHLQSITMGDVNCFNGERGVSMENVVDFLESTRSRTCLRALRLYNFWQWDSEEEPDEEGPPTIIDQFASSFLNGRDIQSPLKLEKFSLGSFDYGVLIPLVTLDTTRLTELRVTKVWIEPDQLTNLIVRASALRRIELSLLSCGHDNCNGPRLRPNKELLMALASHENLTAICFARNGLGVCGCEHFGPEFMGMLRAFGRRGKLRKLALGYSYFRCSSTMDPNQICETIRENMQSLQSITISLFGVTEGSIVNIVSLPQLKELRLGNLLFTQLTASVIKRIAQMPRLKCLALSKLQDDGQNSLDYLANVTTLTDLRIRFGELISNETFEKWSEGFGSNLQILVLVGISMRCIENEKGLIRLLEKAVRLRVLILHGRITDQSMLAIAKSCRELEILGVGISRFGTEITAPAMQKVVGSCPKLKSLDIIYMHSGDRRDYNMRSQLQLPKYRKISSVSSGFWNYDCDYDDDEYD